MKPHRDIVCAGCDRILYRDVEDINILYWANVWCSECKTLILCSKEEYRDRVEKEVKP